MIVNERHNEILNIIKSKRNVSVGELSALLFVSEATVRRDLTQMQRLGLIERTHGGAIATSGTEETSHFVRIVKNAKDGRDFSFYENLIPGCLADLKQCLHTEIVFPALDKNYISVLNNAKLTLKAATTTDRSKTSLKTVMAQARLTNFYHACTDPLIAVMAEWVPETERSENQKQTIAQANKRTQLRNGLTVK